MQAFDITSPQLLLKKLKEKVDKEIKETAKDLQGEPKLKEACYYALVSSAKRLRPLIVHLVADALKSPVDVSYSSLSVEFFHTASLIADDLPCMDDETYRRDKLALYKVYGESTAILASYTLIAMGYEYIYKNAFVAKEVFPANDLCLLAIQKVSSAAGLFGATNGQFLDLFPPDHSLATLEKIIAQKTITLFDVSFTLGWLFGGGDIEQLEKVSSCAYHFGMAFQIADDIIDFEKDCKKGNFATLLGKKNAKKRFYEEMESFSKALQTLHLCTDLFTALQNNVLLRIEKA